MSRRESGQPDLEESPRPTVVLVMAEYFAHPLWDRSPGAVDELDPAELGVSPELGRRLSTWNDTYGRRPHTPAAAADVEAWRREGLSLAHELQHELGAGTEVLYFDERDGAPRPLDDRRLWS